MKKTLAALACLAVLGCSRAPETSAQTVAQKIPTDFYVKQIHDLAVDAGAGAKFWSLGRHLREVDVYRDDLRRYSIRFERYGDFLTVMVDRRGAKTSETLNLGSTRGIRLISGHAPDLGGRLGYVVDETPDDPVHHGNWGTLRSCQMVNPSLGYCGMSYGGPPDNGFHYTVSVEMPPARKKFPTLFVSTTGYAQSTSPESWSGGVNTYVYQTMLIRLTHTNADTR